MDPTYERFLSSSEKESVEKILSKDYAGANFHAESNIESPKNDTKIDAFLRACGSVLDNERNLSSKKRSLTIREEISKYKAAIISNKNPICEFWNLHQSSLPKLASAARKYCIIPAASVPSESRFSIANFVSRKERSNLSSKNLRLTMIAREKSKIKNLVQKK